MPWDPETYARFRAERAAPFYDLLDLVRTLTPKTVVDLGCGSGELTAELARTFADASILGIDRSAEMLAHAFPLAHGRLSFRPQDIEDVVGTFDLVFSNAALQWLPDHEGLLERIWTHVAPGGTLAVGVPSNFDHPSHRLLAETAAERPYREALSGWNRGGAGSSATASLDAAPTERASPVLGLARYAERLFELGAVGITAFEKIYPAVLNDADGVLDWVSGTALVPYVDRLGELAPAFRESYRAKLRRQWPEGPVFYAFKRTLFVANKL